MIRPTHRPPGAREMLYIQIRISKSFENTSAGPSTRLDNDGDKDLPLWILLCEGVTILEVNLREELVLFVAE